MTTRRILVLGEDTQSFLTVIRSLGRAGMEVHVAWCAMDSPALASRYVHRVHQVPGFQQGSVEWIGAFQELLRRERFDLVLPTTDGVTLPLQRYREQMEPLARLYLLPEAVYRTCANKDATWELAHRLGIAVPRQQVVAGVEDARRAAARFGYPLVLKPTASAAEHNPLERQQVRKAEREGELEGLIEEMTAAGAILAQENFIGVGVGVEVLCREGEVLLAFQHERVHEPLRGGGSSYRKSVALDAEMLAATARLMGELRYTGVAMVEYKQNPVTGRWVLIEINARFWGSLALSAAAGLDFPKALVELLLDGRTAFPNRYRVGLYCRHWSRDLQWLLANARADKADPTLQTRRARELLGEIWTVLRLRERSDTLTLDDPEPAWVDLRQFFAEKLFRGLKGLRLFRAMHRWRLRRLYRRSDRVVVLCYGNICRSPFAGELLAQQRSGTVISRGLHPTTGRRSPRDAVTAAAAFGVALEDHRSALLTPEELRAADLVLLFDRKNWLGVRAMAPEQMARVAYLGAADPGQPLEIADPYGEGPAAFERCYRRIELALRGLQGARAGSGAVTGTALPQDEHLPS